jgi:small subunit ribosomal protein S16
MVVIRLRRAGSKKRPFFRMVVTDSRAPRDSSFVEILGHYNPRTKPAFVQVDQARVDFWIKRGAQPSDSVRTLIARHLTPVPVAVATTLPAAVVAPVAVAGPVVAVAAAPPASPVEVAADAPASAEVPADAPAVVPEAQ